MKKAIAEIKLYSTKEENMLEGFGEALIYPETDIKISNSYKIIFKLDSILKKDGIRIIRYNGPHSVTKVISLDRNGKICIDLVNRNIHRYLIRKGQIIGKLVIVENI